MQHQRHLDAPLDRRTAERLADQGLRYELVGADDELDSWNAVVARGFHRRAPATDEQRDELRRERQRGDRLVAVRDQGVEPIGTARSWIAPLTVPGPAQVELWALGAVTVAPTHAGRGIFRAMIEGELHAAADSGVPLAGLTVTESTLYSRFGFGIATQAASLEIDMTRVRWSGPAPSLRIRFIDLREAADELARLHAEVIAAVPGELLPRQWAWSRSVGADEPASVPARERRCVRVVDGGRTVGVAVYSFAASETDFTHHTLTVQALVANGRDAAAALWRFLLGQPLVRTIRADLRPVDDPVRSWIGDWRGARWTIEDHHWIRILDVPAALRARTFAAGPPLALRVADALGFASGEYLLDESGDCRRSPVVGGTALLELDASALASLYLGTFTPSQLAAEGRLVAAPDALAAADRRFVVARAPHLSVWY